MLLRILFVTCVTWKQKKNKTNPHIFIAVSECPFKKKKKFITEIRQPTRWQSRNDVSHVMRILNGSENKSWSLAVSMEYETWLLGGFQGEARSFKCHWRNDVLRPFVYYLVNLGKFLAKTAADLRNFYANINVCSQQWLQLSPSIQQQKIDMKTDGFFVCQNADMRLDCSV